MNVSRFALTLFVVLVVVSGCHNLPSPEPGIGDAIEWSALPNWQGDDLSEAWLAMDQQCPRMNRRDSGWVPICAAVDKLQNPSSSEVREFFETHFRPHRIHAEGGKIDGLITGYYEPLLNGSLTRTDQYQYPIYSAPEGMLTIELDQIYPSLKGMRLRGRLEGDKIVPFHSRAVIDSEGQPLKGQELLWIDDPYGSFFLQIQGSGRVKLEDGSVKGLNYADQNGHPYVAIGKTLVAQDHIPLEEVSLFTIREWLNNNPDRADEILNTNPSYVFFTLRENANENARGSLNVPLTQARSLAVDKSVIPLGTPVWLDTTLPDGSDYQRLMVAQDTGGAIRGHVRADVFFGEGDEAEQLAGEMKQAGEMYALLPIGSK